MYNMQCLEKNNSVGYFLKLQNIVYYQIGLVNLLINSKPVGVPNISYFLRETQLSQHIYH